jgi:hypothetical protein
MERHARVDPLVENFVRALVSTGASIHSAIAGLLESIEEEGGDPWPGEEPIDVLIEMTAGSIWPALRRFAPSEVEGAIELIDAADERFMADLKLAAEIAERRESMRTR